MTGCHRDCKHCAAHTLTRYTDGTYTGEVNCPSTWANGPQPVTWISLGSGRRIRSPRTDTELARRSGWCSSCGHRAVQ